MAWGAAGGGFRRPRPRRGAARRADLVEGRGRVLDGVVEQAGHDAGSVETHVGDDGGDAHRVHEVGLPRAAKLPGVHLLRERVGLGDQGGVRVGIIRLNLGDEFMDCQIALASRAM